MKLSELSDRQILSLHAASCLIKDPGFLGVKEAVRNTDVDDLPRDVLCHAAGYTSHYLDAERSARVQRYWNKATPPQRKEIAAKTLEQLRPGFIPECWPEL